MRREQTVPRRLDGRHHAIAADGDDARAVGDRHLHLAQLALRERAHRLDDIAAEGAVLWAARLWHRPAVDAPDDLVGSRFDIVDLVYVLALAARGKRAPAIAARAAPCRSKTAPRCRGRRPRARP